MRSMFGRLVAHQAVAVGADVGDADVVAPDDEDVRLASGRSGCRWLCGRRGLLRLRERAGCHCRRCHQGRRAEQNIAAVEGVVFSFVRWTFRVGPWSFVSLGIATLLLHNED